MPKMKTNSSAKKRFRLTASGKVKFKKSNRNHILTKKSTKRKRRLRGVNILSKTEDSHIAVLLPYGVS